MTKMTKDERAGKAHQIAKFLGPDWYVADVNTGWQTWVTLGNTDPDIGVLLGFGDDKIEVSGRYLKDWQIIARHKWVSGATITESYKVDDSCYRRFTATIRGWRNWRIWQGYTGMKATAETWTTEQIRDKVLAIRERIDTGDESVFAEP